MKNKTKETVRQFVGVSPEWEVAVVKTATGYDAVCKRTQGNEVQYGHTLCSLKYKKNAETVSYTQLDVYKRQSQGVCSGV